MISIRFRSGLNNIHSRAGSYFFVVQGERSAVDPGAMSDEQRMWKYELWPRPFGLRPEIGANGVAALGNTTNIPCARRLVVTDFRVQRGRGYY